MTRERQPTPRTPRAPRVALVIPARLGSSRFPGKALVEINGHPLIYYVWREALKVKRASRVVIASDSREILTTAKSFGAETIRTSARLRNGTERTAEVASRISADIFINVQGDTAIYRASWIDRAIEDMLARRSEFHTLAIPITQDESLFNPAVVKVAIGKVDDQARALWFSRYPIPFVRDAKGGAKTWLKIAKFWRHIGIYLYTRHGLAQYSGQPMGAIERAESLEQMRILEAGWTMGVTLVRGRAVSVDSPRDIAVVERYL